MGAQVTVEDSALPPQIFRYLLLHALSPGNVQKNLDKGAAEGYRLFPHTLAALSALPLFWRNRRYRLIQATNTVSYSMRESSAERNVVEDQVQGFALLETAQILGQRVVIPEKALPSASHPQRFICNDNFVVQGIYEGSRHLIYLCLR